MRRFVCLGLALAFGVLFAACSPPAPSRTSEGTGAQPPAAKKRLLATVHSDPAGLHLQLTQPSNPVVPGLAQVHQLLNAALTYSDDEDVLQPHLAEAVPTVENGLWKVLPDGRMETSWRLKTGILWHDGAAFTAEDLLFSYRVNQDRELGIFRPATLDLIDSVEMADSRTVIVRWKVPFIEADTLFGPSLVMPLPRHLLEETYLQDKGSLFTLPYWREEFVGTGPYRMVEWERASHISLVANDQYILGRPKIDEIEVRFITDFNTIVANLLSGSVEMFIGGRFPAEQAVSLRDTAPNLNVVLADRLGGVVPLYPQYVNTDPPVLADVEFRRALLQGIDRKEMNDTIQLGIGPIAHSWLQPDTVEYQAIEKQVVRYEYDPRRASQTIEGLGYARGPDGLLRDSGGQRLHIEVRTTDQERIHTPTVLSVVDYMKRLGIEAEANILPMQRLTDREYVATFPAFHITTGGQGLGSTTMLRWRTSQTPSPANQWTGQNRGRYSSPAFDALIEGYGRTISKPERLVVLGEIIHHQTDQLSHLPLLYEATGAVLGSKRLKNVTSVKMWNAHLWDFS